MQASMAAEVETHSLAPGVRLGAYTIVRPLAVGGMAELYLAAPTRGDAHPVALKRMLPHLAWDPEFVRMFLDEVRIIAGLDHPNIVRVLDYGIGDGSHFFAMEYVHGQTVGALQRQWKGPTPIPLSVGVAIVEAVASGLHYAHEPGPDRSGLVHRDVSPANVMVAYDGTVKLLDFGIARLSQETQRTRAGTLKGKVGYMSPEQCKGAGLDRRSDVFGLGVLLYELSVRRRAFFGDNDFAVMNKIVKGEFTPAHEVSPELPGEVEALISDALSVKPDDRPATAAEFGERLRAWADAAGMDRSPRMLESFLHDRFGSVPSPSLDVPAPELEPAQEMLPPPAASPRRAWPIGVALGVGGVGLVLGGYLIGRSPADTPAARVVAPLAPSEAAGSTGRAPPAVKEDPPSQKDSSPSATPQDTDGVIVLEDEPAPASRSTKRRKAKRRGKKRAPSTTKDAPDAPSRPGSSVLPPSWRDRAN